MNQTKFIIITTINKPTDAICRYSQWKNWNVVVVGDRKSPVDWQCEGVTYFNIEAQYSYSSLSLLAKAIPENTYLRKMFGYAYAIQNGATVIFETDDDNIPYDDAEIALEETLKLKNNISNERLSSEVGWLNVYQKFGAQGCWPRGFPIEFVKHPGVGGQRGNDLKPWKVMQFLADKDPDVDAIYRMLAQGAVNFARNRIFLLDEGTFCPFNSQATLWLPEAFPLLFLPIGVSDRVADILRGYMALACLWKMKGTLAYSSPIVFQERNAHNLLTDFSEEILLYLNADKWSRLLKNITGSGTSDYYRSALKLLCKENVLSAECTDLYMHFLSASGIE
ncbi:hypothetical protein KJ656_12710 [bacterium]|nr:hypothetical protein [bacterium]